jgi:hypothetical protein
MLQEKWKAEPQDRFSIETDIVNAKQLHDLLTKASRDPNTSFNAIGSLESLRTKRSASDAEAPSGARQQLAAVLANHETTVSPELLDLVIIDEAHYLRNPATASNYLASLLAGVASPWSS